MAITKRLTAGKKRNPPDETPRNRIATRKKIATVKERLENAEVAIGAILSTLSQVDRDAVRRRVSAHRSRRLRNANRKR